jgi:TolB-like protein
VIAPIPIAVLLLINVSQDPSNEYFADGLTDEIIRNLSIIDGGGAFPDFVLCA